MALYFIVHMMCNISLTLRKPFLSKNMTPEDMAKLISEMEAMPVAQKEQLKSMGMDPDTSEYSNI